MDIAEFARWCIVEGAFNACDLDGASIQEKATKCGLLNETKYDPDVHGESDCGYVERGDPWFVFSDEFKKLLKSSN